MHSFTIHESRNLKQARPKGQYVDLLRYTLATPSWDFMNDILSLSMSLVKLFKPDASLHEIQFCLIPKIRIHLHRIIKIILPIIPLSRVPLYTLYSLSPPAYSSQLISKTILSGPINEFSY